MYQYSQADVAALRRGGHRTAVIRYAATTLPAARVVRVGTLCERR
jgi:hypothetical protein